MAVSNPSNMIFSYLLIFCYTKFKRNVCVTFVLYVASIYTFFCCLEKFSVYFDVNKEGHFSQLLRYEKPSHKSRKNAIHQHE